MSSGRLGVVRVYTVLQILTFDDGDDDCDDDDAERDDDYDDDHHHYHIKVAP